MANLSASNFSNPTDSSEMPAQGGTRNVAEEVSLIITIIINGITCPFTVVLNVMVIMAVKRRPRLQINTNILLACLAATDALTGLATQPSLIVWKSFYVNGIDSSVVQDFHSFFLRALTVCSPLHLILITCERLIVVKFTHTLWLNGNLRWQWAFFGCSLLCLKL